MAKNSANDIEYFLSIDTAHKEYVASLRHWSNLKVGFDGTTLWLRGCTREQISSVEVQRIPYTTIYYAQDNKLFCNGSLLPVKNIPALLWSPLHRGIPVALPAYNHNFFGVEEKLPIALIPCVHEHDAYALLTPLAVLQSYITTAPAIRLQQLQWAILSEQKALVLGVPLLPLPGDSWWRKGNMLLPMGYDFELHVLDGILDRSISPNAEAWILWNADATYFLVKKKTLMPLSLSSFRLST